MIAYSKSLRLHEVDYGRVVSTDSKGFQIILTVDDRVCHNIVTRDNKVFHINVTVDAKVLKKDLETCCKGVQGYFECKRVDVAFQSIIIVTPKCSFPQCNKRHDLASLFYR